MTVSFVNETTILDKTVQMYVCSSVGRASDYRAGGLGFEPQTGPTLRVLK